MQEMKKISESKDSHALCCCRMVGVVSCLPDCTLSYARCRYRRRNRRWSQFQRLAYSLLH